MKKLLIDSREPKWLINLIRKEKIFDVTIKKLPTFDYIIGGKIGIERKTFPDLVGSVVDRRLYDQIRRMLKTKYKPYFLIEGIPSYAYQYLAYNRYFKGEAKEVALGTLVSIAVSFNIPTVYAENGFDIVYILNKMANQKEVYRDKLKTPDKSLRPTEKILCLVDGVGASTAKKIVKKIGKNIAFYNKYKLKSVNGVGEKTATNIVRFIGDSVAIK